GLSKLSSLNPIKTEIFFCSCSSCKPLSNVTSLYLNSCKNGRSPCALNSGFHSRGAANPTAANELAARKFRREVCFWVIVDCHLIRVAQLSSLPEYWNEGLETSAQTIAPCCWLGNCRRKARQVAITLLS